MSNYMLHKDFKVGYVKTKSSGLSESIKTGFSRQPISNNIGKSRGQQKITEKMEIDLIFINIAFSC